MHTIGARGGVCPKVEGRGAYDRLLWFSHETIDPTEILLSRCTRAAEN